MFLVEVLGALLVIGLVVLFLAILSIPFVLAVAILVAAVKLALFIVLIPFRLLGWAFGAALGR